MRQLAGTCLLQFICSYCDTKQSCYFGPKMEQRKVLATKLSASPNKSNTIFSAARLATRSLNSCVLCVARCRGWRAKLACVTMVYRNTLTLSLWPLSLCTKWALAVSYVVACCERTQWFEFAAAVAFCFAGPQRTVGAIRGRTFCHSCLSLFLSSQLAWLCSLGRLYCADYNLRLQFRRPKLAVVSVQCW